MKKIAFSISIILIVCSVLNAQNPKLVRANSLKKDNNLEEAIPIYMQLVRNQETALEANFNLACCYALQNQPDFAFIYLTSAINQGARPEDIFTDTDFLNLYKDDRWNLAKDTIIARYLRQYPNITHKELSVEMWLMSIEDQRFRTLHDNYKLSEPPNKQTYFKIQTQEYRNERVKQIIEEYGWPTFSMVGDKAATFAFFALQHDLPKKLKKYLPLVIEAANKKEASWKHAAMMIDRYLSWTKNVQIYGTQFGRTGESKKQGGEINWTSLKPTPIADEENIAKRREKAGLGTIEENFKRMGLTYTPVSERGNYVSIPLKKSWVKKGYVVGE